MNSVAVPDAGDDALLVSGTAATEGGLGRSLDGTLLTFAGYHAERGAFSTSLANQSGAAAPRGLATVSARRVYTLMETSATVYSGNNIRGATGDGTNNFWTAGSSKGTSRSIPRRRPWNVRTSGGNTIAVRTRSGNLYFSTQKGAGGIYTFQGGGLPKTGTATNPSSRPVPAASRPGSTSART